MKLKITDKQKASACAIGRKHNAKEVFVNDKGEFFLSESDCKNSCGHDSEKYAKVDVTAEVVKSEKVEKTPEELKAIALAKIAKATKKEQILTEGGTLVNALIQFAEDEEIKAAVDAKVKELSK